MKEYCIHPAITPSEYARGLMRSWSFGKPEVFQILLERANQKDLNMVKERYADKMYERLHQAIDQASELVPPAGSRLSRFPEGTILEVPARTTEAFVEDRPSSRIKEEQEQLEMVQVQEGGEAQVRARQKGSKKKARRGLKRRQQRKRKNVRRSHQRRR